MSSYITRLKIPLVCLPKYHFILFIKRGKKKLKATSTQTVKKHAFWSQVKKKKTFVVRRQVGLCDGIVNLMIQA